MPYKTIKELPDYVRKLPEEKQKQWLEVFNSVYAETIEDGKTQEEAEQAAFKQANGVVKTMSNRFSITLQLKAGKLAKIKLLYPGKFSHSLYGDFEVTEKHLKQAIKNFDSNIGTRLDENGAPMLPGNYQHSGHDPNPENAKACGWIRKLMIENNELFGLIDWTDKAKEYIQAKEYQFISPEFDFNWTDENGIKQGFTMLGFALTNVNFLKKNQMPVTLTELRTVVTDLINTQFNKKEVPLMNDELRKLLKLTDETADGVKEVTQLMDSVKSLTENVKNLEAEKKQLTDKIAAYETQLGDKEKEAIKLSERVNNLEKTIKLQDAENFIDSQIYDKNTNSGKILPAQRQVWLDSYLNNPEQTKKLIESLPTAIQGGEIGSNQGGPQNGKKTPDVLLNEKTVELMQKTPGLKYQDAFAIIQQQNPDLVKAYTRDIRGSINPS